jgi:DNA-binding transcriptional MerR regulator
MVEEKYVQGTFFGDSLPELGEGCGYGTAIVMKATGLTRRQLDHWDSAGIFSPSLQPAKGSGSRRLYSFKDILVLQVFQRLKDTGVSLQKIKKAAKNLLDRGIEDLSSITLCSDGTNIYQVVSGDDIIDILKGGQGVFAVSVASVRSEVENKLLQFPTSTVKEEFIPESVREFKKMMANGDI